MIGSRGQLNIKSKAKEKIVSLFNFIKKLNELKQKAVFNVKDYPWCLPILSLHDDPDNITINYRDRVENEEQGITSTLLSVRRAEFQKCPEPDPIIKEWLEEGWDDYKLQSVKVKENLNLDNGNLNDISKQIDDNNGVKRERFGDDDNRVKAFDIWKKRREDWQKKQEIIAKTRELFSKLYGLYFELQKESETEEIIVANGMLYDKLNNDIRHPLLTHRVKITFDPDEYVIYIEDTDTPSELYTALIHKIEDIEKSSVKQMNEDLHRNDYHPLDRNDTPQFLKLLVKGLSSESQFCENPSNDIFKEDWRLLLSMEPCYIVRKRLDGTVKTIDSIIETLQKDEEQEELIPPALCDIVCGGVKEIYDEPEEDTIQDRLASVGGESIDILLSKEANSEQLEIAKRIEHFNAVLVQGPPGTGKTHTIANLMGHFFAQGKSVLVTSQNPKALAVLKEKIPEGLQNLCVSILDDSNVDMKRSIEGITEYISRTNYYELKKNMDELADERKNVINQLSVVRQKIFKLIQEECNNIVLNGESISPSNAAKFVLENEKKLSNIIRGEVALYKNLPLSIEQLKDLYRSNQTLSPDEEYELNCNLPDSSSLISPLEFENALKVISIDNDYIENVKQTNELNIIFDDKENINISSKFGDLLFVLPEKEKIEILSNHLNSFEKIEPWMRKIVVDGNRGGSDRQHWLTMIDKLKSANTISKIVADESFRNKIVLPDKYIESTYNSYKLIGDVFKKNGTISKIKLFFNPDFKRLLSLTSINGHEIENIQDYDAVMHCLQLTVLRNESSKYWDHLMANNGIPKFFDLNNEPESISVNFIPKIDKYLNWYDSDFNKLIEILANAGIPTDIFYKRDELESDLDVINKIIDIVDCVIRPLCDVCFKIYEILEMQNKINSTINIFNDANLKNSKICNCALSALNDRNVENYRNAFNNLDSIHKKYDLQRNRDNLLSELEPYAHDWASDIINRYGIHGEATIPENIELAWKWKQLSGIIDELTKQSFADLQNESLNFSRYYRETTAKYAETCGWYYLLLRVGRDISMMQALNGWKQTQDKIGKGTGKSAPALKAAARELMAKCQKAVPGWIMPINKAMEVLNPIENRFDVIIIDEASQADISSLAILYMGKQLIIVGDDKQVSPVGIGLSVDDIANLEQTYIKGSIPNSHLYNGKTSIYDIASTTFQPLMLREHFRCVPDIIGFSNMLSYDNKIKPLRDASSTALFPSVVNYRVKDGFREGDVNINEAKTIIALMLACISQKEYEGKTMGVISLLGNDQAKKIQQLMEKYIPPKEMIERNIICGNSSNFQGDERDVIFLSLVDSHKEGGPLFMRDFGPDDINRKRYNVATSRAKDQLWVIDSLDPENDLKSGDIRKTLINYSLDPHAIENKKIDINNKSESPFEKDVATALTNRGFHLIQQYEVGAYRLDMVAVSKGRKVAIECDGEFWHSGEAKIREDMERQTILERSGWCFIRIRGSEYYRNPEKTINRVVKELKERGVIPEEYTSSKNESIGSSLLDRVKTQANLYLSKISDDGIEPVFETISSALNPTALNKKIVNKEIKLYGYKEKLSIANNNADAKIGTTALSINPSGTIQRFANLDVYTSKSSYDKFKSKYSVQSSYKNNDSANKGNPKNIDRTNINKSNDSIKNKSDNRSKNTLGQQLLLPNTGKSKKDIDGLISFLNANKIKFIDKRHLNGALWIVGGWELLPIIKKCKDFGFHFWYKEDGGKQTGYKPGWWTK